MEKLKVAGPKAKAGSHHPLTWTVEEIADFEKLKLTMGANLSLFQVEPEESFQLRTDASHTAIGSVLEQKRNGSMVPVCFFSRKLTPPRSIGPPRRKRHTA